MSLDASIWAWKQKPLRPSLKLILLSLADRASDDDLCWPSIARLSDDTGLDRKTIIEGLGLLCYHGLIQKTGEYRGRTKSIPVYQLIGVIHRSSTVNGTSAKSGTSKQYRFSVEAVPKTDNNQYQKRDTEPIREPIKEPEKPVFKKSENMEGELAKMRSMLKIEDIGF